MGAAKRFAGSAASGTDPKRRMEDGRHTDCGPSVRPKGSRIQSGPRRRVAIGATRKTMLALAPQERRNRKGGGEDDRSHGVGHASPGP